jgi:hypothetical protein
VLQLKAKTMLPYKLDTTNDLLTSRAGLICIAQVMEQLKLGQRIDQHFPLPKSNRGFKPSVFIQTLILMQHEGSFHLDDVRHISDDNALREILELKKIPQANTLGEWLRKTGNMACTFSAWQEVNKTILKTTLHHCKKVTLDIDATEIIAHKTSAQWTYKKNKGYMPMVGHIAQTGQVVSVDFREGNASPAKENFEFIKQCQKALPSDCTIDKLRIDAAGYQKSIIQYCDDLHIEYAIRAKTSATLKAQIASRTEEDWQVFINKEGEAVKNQHTYRMPHWISDYEEPFTLIIQRTKIEGQVELNLSDGNHCDEVIAEGYVYRAIATNRDSMSDSELIHWYNQRAEDSENRIKELKLDFGGDVLPCSDFKANALYFLISALSFNLFALMRQLLPEKLAQHRASTIRWRLYAMAGKVVKTARQTYLKLKQGHYQLLNQVLEALRRFDPPDLA